MKKNKGFGALAAIFAIVLFVYILLFALVPFQKSTATWIVFVFSIISIASGFFVIKYAFNDEGDLKSKIYGVPIARIGILYPCIQVAFSFVFFAVGAFASVPYWIVLLLSVILLAAAAIGVIATSAAKTVIEDAESKIENVTGKVKLFNLNIGSIVNLSNDEEVKKELSKLSEAFRFSDPVSSEETEEIEAKIETELDELRILSGKDEKEKTLEKIKEVSNLLSERNRLCKAFKK